MSRENPPVSCETSGFVVAGEGLEPPTSGLWVQIRAFYIVLQCAVKYWYYWIFWNCCLLSFGKIVELFVMELNFCWTQIVPFFGIFSCATGTLSASISFLYMPCNNTKPQGISRHNPLCIEKKHRKRCSKNDSTFLSLCDYYMRCLSKCQYHPRTIFKIIWNVLERAGFAL